MTALMTATASPLTLDRAVEAAILLNLDHVPGSVASHAGRVIADAVGVARGGARTEAMVRLVAIDTAEGLVDAPSATPPQRLSTVLTSPTRRTSAANAAFLNATAGTFLELDEGMRPTGHPSMHIVPAAIAVAQRNHASGVALLRAVLAGYELTSRLFRAFRLRYPVHPHGHFGAVGAAVAVALIDDVDPVIAARIASTTPILSMWDACYEGANARNTYTGLAAQTGVRAASLARAGFLGSESALLRAFSEIAGELVDASVLEAPLNYGDLGITHNYFKIHSACALTHAAIDAVLEMEARDVSLIRSVRVETVQNNMKLDRQPVPNDLSVRFSLPYAVATALALRRSDPEAFHFRPEIASLARKVTVVVAADLEAEWPSASPARVIIDLGDETITNTVRNPRGYYTSPISADELRAKFVQLVASEAEAAIWWKRLTDLPSVADCASLFDEVP